MTRWTVSNILFVLVPEKTVWNKKIEEETRRMCVRNVSSIVAVLFSEPRQVATFCGPSFNPLRQIFQKKIFQRKIPELTPPDSGHCPCVCFDAVKVRQLFVQWKKKKKNYRVVELHFFLFGVSLLITRPMPSMFLFKKQQDTPPPREEIKRRRPHFASLRALSRFTARQINWRKRLNSRPLFPPATFLLKCFK